MKQENGLLENDNRIEPAAAPVRVDGEWIESRDHLTATAAETGGGRMSLPKNEGLAAVLSVLLPGLGQFYNGRFLWGILWFLITPGLWIGSGGTLGWLFHVFSGMQAYYQAKKKNREATPG